MCSVEVSSSVLFNSTEMLTSGDLKSVDFLYSTLHVNPPNNKLTQSTKLSIGVTQDIIRSLTWNTEHQNSLFD